MRDIATRDDIEVVVRDFYTRAFDDPLLGPVFVDIAQMDLEAHMPIMCDFWETVIFRAGLYKRNALQVHVDLHAKADLTAEHFGRWVDLWHATVDDHFAGENADQAKVQGARIAYSISRRLMGESGSEFVTIRRPTLEEVLSRGGPSSGPRSS
jgi:hemoglobin